MTIDLTGNFFNIIQPEILAGQDLILDFSVVNNGDQDLLTPFLTDIYLSADENISAAEDVKLGTYGIKTTINAGGNTGIKRYGYKTPELGNGIWEKGDGKYYIGLDIDAKNDVLESNETNNSNQGLELDSFALDVTGLNQLADVVVTDFKAPANFKAGDTITVEYELTNQGGEQAELFAAGFYLFTQNYLAKNNNLSIEDIPEVFYLQGDSNSSLITLNPGQSTGKMTTQLTIPQEWAGFSGVGDYYLGVEADPYDDVVERSDANNSLTGETKDYQKISLDAPVDNTVDLVGTHFNIAQDQILPGQTLDLGFTIANKGLAKAQNVKIDLYISQDENISADEDYYLGTYDIAEIAGERDCGLKNYSYQTPDADNPLWSKGNGAYHVGMVIDPDNNIVETDETNNKNLGKDLDRSPVNVVGLGELPDLVVNSVNLNQENIQPGDTVEVQYQIANQGTETAELFAAGFYLVKKDYVVDSDGLSIDDVPEVYFFQGDRESSLLTLEPGTNTGVLTTEITLPTEWEGFDPNGGEYYIAVAADPYNDVLENEELNNSLSSEVFEFGTSAPPDLELAEVHRFYQYQRGTHLYTSDTNEIEIVKNRSEAGELNYNYEEAKFNVLSSDKDTVTGADIEGAEEVYRFFNRDTGAHLYTMDEVERKYIEDNLSNYNYEGIKFYAFEEEQENVETLPVTRMLNTQSGSHLFTIDQVEVDYIKNNLPNFNLEGGDNGAAFYVMDI
jgi:subtilase family serine protease